MRHNNIKLPIDSRLPGGSRPVPNETQLQCPIEPAATICSPTPGTKTDNIYKKTVTINCCLPAHLRRLRFWTDQRRARRTTVQALVLTSALLGGPPVVQNSLRSRTRAYTRTRIHAHEHTRTRTYTHMRRRQYARTHMRPYAHTSTCAHANTRTHAYAHPCIRATGIRAYVHLCIHA